MIRIFMSAIALGVLCCAQDAAAADPDMRFEDIMNNPAMRVLVAAVVMACVEALKQWKWFADKALVAPVARSAMALLLSVGPAIAMWVSTGDVNAGLSILGTTWMGSMSINALVGAATNKP